MSYTGEHLIYGQLGNFFIVLSLVAAGVATFSFARATRPQEPTDQLAWLRLGRIAFITQSTAVFAIFGLLVYLLQQHLFEYHYAWKHSSRSLEFKYLLAAIWEGQEGSFLLWMTCHSILGLLLLRGQSEWRPPVMSVLSMAQFALTTMITGLYIVGWKMGSNPFLLLRDSGVLDNAPALHLNFDVSQPLRPDYLSSIKDGNDLNPLLQNYWMVIHPPVLFMGFASTIIPFAYAIAGLWKKNFGGWASEALPWALFSTAVLGVGIMMGGMWAYESLSFGGYWAWDPVENASLVPWMIGVAGLHTLLIYKATQHSLRATYLFFILGFLFILYSTFLTRSGILGETSVHAFTDLGMNWQLLAFVAVFAVPSLGWLALRYRQIPSPQKEEETSSREFWMFIGSLLFFLSALVIIGQTSLPVFNKLFGTNLAPPEDVEFSYNSIQIYVAIIIAWLTALTQYFKYRHTDSTYFRKKMLLPFLISLAVFALYAWLVGVDYDRKGPVFEGSIWLAVFLSIYSLVANTFYIWIGANGQLKNAGGSIAHVGFSMVLLGIFISSSNKEIISNNIDGIPAPLAAGENPRENLTLIQNMPVNMANYTLTYEGDSAHPKKQLWYYKIRFTSNNGTDSFLLTPNAFVNYKGNEGLMANPDARHYLSHDIFTYITSIPNPENAVDTSRFIPYIRKAGDTLFYSKGTLQVQPLVLRDSVPEALFGKNGKLYEVPIKVEAATGSAYQLTLRAAFAKGQWIPLPDTLTAEGMIVQLQRVLPDGSVELGIKESDALLKYVTLKAYKYPFIKLLWYGVWLTAIGLLISMVRRIRLYRARVTS
ncbi:MAG: cytochrome c assembly protein [Chitinophagia bacterium]|nr:cytochrome c assembly protein [Chitinophagia bacterium]